MDKITEMYWKSFIAQIQLILILFGIFALFGLIDEVTHRQICLNTCKNYETCKYDLYNITYLKKDNRYICLCDLCEK